MERPGDEREGERGSPAGGEAGDYPSTGFFVIALSTLLVLAGFVAMGVIPLSCG